MARSKYKRQGKAKFIMYESYLVRSAAFQSLDPNDKAAYFELKWRYDGLNNGRIGLGNRELADTIHTSKDTARRSLDTLAERGFIVKMKASGFNVKNRTATEWRLTEYACDMSGHLATKDFMRWSPEKKEQAHHRDVQAHHRDSGPSKPVQKQPDRRTTGTVSAISGSPQAHHRDTYNITTKGRQTGDPDTTPAIAAPLELNRKRRAG